MINVKNRHQMNILRELMFHKNMSYTTLSEACKDHDLFNYHLKELISKEYILKDQKGYSLTDKGKEITDFMEEDTKIQDRFKTSIFIWPIRNKKVLLHKRLKHPYYGYVGSISGKMKIGEKIDETITRELKDEINIEPISIELLGVKRAIFVNKKKKVTTDGIYLVYLISDFKGKIKLNGIEGDYFWEDIDKVLDYDKMFKKGISYDIDWIKEYVSNSNRYRIKFAEFEVTDLDF